jgi:undecaprenyl-diphosphatase
VSLLTAAFLGLVQGLTEFIPVSSKTHLVVVPALLHIKTPSLQFIALLHAGTVVALLIYFARDLWGIAKDLPKKGGEGRTLVVLLLIATIPAAVVGKLEEKNVEKLLQHPRGDALALLLTALLLLGAEWLSGSIGSRTAKPTRDKVVLKDAIVMGCAQAFALFPGISRSGSTMGSGLAMGLRRETAARFAFLMSIPIIIGADLLELPKYLSNGLTSIMIVGFLSALISGFAAVAFLMRYLRNHSFLPFAAYCAVFAVGAFLLLTYR